MAKEKTEGSYKGEMVHKSLIQRQKEKGSKIPLIWFSWEDEAVD